MPRSRAFSLIEILVATGVAGLITSVALLLFVLVGRKLIWIEQMSDQQMVGVFARQFVQSDLQHSAPDGILVAEPSSLAIALQREPVSGGNRRWDNFPVVWGSHQERLVRAHQTSTQLSETAPPALRIPLGQALQQWTSRSFLGCRLQSVERNGGGVSFQIAFRQRRWDGGWQEMTLPGRVDFSL